MRNLSQSSTKKKPDYQTWRVQYESQILKASIIDRDSNIYDGEHIISQVVDIAHKLIEKGIANKEVCLIWGNEAQWFILMMALLETKNSVTVISADETSDEIRDKIKECINTIIISSDALSLIEDIYHAKSVFIFENNEFEIKFSSDIKISDFPNANNPGINIFSSGTTGQAKIIPLSIDVIHQVIQVYMKELEQGKYQSILSILPLSAIYSITIGFAVIFSGRKLVIADPNNVNLTKVICENKIEVIPAVPLVINKIENSILSSIKTKMVLLRLTIYGLMKLCWFIRRSTHLNIGRIIFRSIHKAIGKDLKLFLSGGSTLSKSTLIHMYSLGFTIYEGYGLTESGGVVTMRKNDFRGFGSAGKALADMKIKIRSTKSEQGEILIKSSRMSSEYISEEWFSTGDVGSIDKHGNLHISGRINDIIVLADESKCMSAAIEQLYSKLTSVEEVSVLGEINEMFNGDEIILFVKLKKGTNSSRLRQELIDVKMSDLYRAHAYIVVDEMPKNVLGKTKKHILLKMSKENARSKVWLPLKK